jgi:hypothetical protein
VLWRELLQGVTDALYLKPTVRYDLLEGLSATAAVIYSHAVMESRRRRAAYKPLGLEADLGLSYQSDGGFVFALEYGVLEPLDGLGYAVAAGGNLSRARPARPGWR